MTRPEGNTEVGPFAPIEVLWFNALAPAPGVAIGHAHAFVIDALDGTVDDLSVCQRVEVEALEDEPVREGQPIAPCSFCKSACSRQV